MRVREEKSRKNRDHAYDLRFESTSERKVVVRLYGVCIKGRNTFPRPVKLINFQRGHNERSRFRSVNRQ